MLLSQVMQYRVGDHVLDLRRFEVRKKGGVLPAEPQVLSLLFLLVENRDRLVSKDELVEVVWGGRAISDSAISSRIKSARQLLSDDGEAQRLIRTIHGKGFRFVGEVLPGETEIPEIPSDRNGTKPSIAVLPFDCEDAGLSVISHGVPHDLIVGLSRLRSLTVIARGSSFRFRGWTGDLSQIGSTLGVDYCLTGTVHRAGARVVVAVELVDARTSSVVWGELCEGTLDKLHEVRENILVQIVSTLELQISHHEAETARLRSPDDLSAWSCYHLGLQHIFRFNRSDNEHGLRYFEQAVGRDPTFSQAHAGVSFARFQNAFMRYSADAEEEAKLARRAAETALELQSDAGAVVLAGRRDSEQRSLAGAGHRAQPQLRTGRLFAGLDQYDPVPRGSRAAECPRSDAAKSYRPAALRDDRDGRVHASDARRRGDRSCPRRPGCSRTSSTRHDRGDGGYLPSMGRKRAGNLLLGK